MPANKAELIRSCAGFEAQTERQATHNSATSPQPSAQKCNISPSLANAGPFAGLIHLNDQKWAGTAQTTLSFSTSKPSVTRIEFTGHSITEHAANSRENEERISSSESYFRCPLLLVYRMSSVQGKVRIRFLRLYGRAGTGRIRHVAPPSKCSDTEHSIVTAMRVRFC